MPLWFGQINKRIFNPIELRQGKRPILTHVGRSSGRTYRTPMDAHKIDGGYAFILVYSSECDWVRNVLAAGTAELQHGGKTVSLTNPRIETSAEAWNLLSDDADKPPGFLNVSELLLCDLA